MAKKKRNWNAKTLRLGLVLTLVVVAADWLGLLSTPENLLYDRRARYCQHFLPPPTDRLVHIDIDDDSLSQIGMWPWPRAYLAKIIDEISLAKPKVIGMDMYFPEAALPNGELQRDGSFLPVRNDDLFAASVQRAANVLLPISVAFETHEARDELRDKMEALLTRDLELDEAALHQQLSQSGSSAVLQTQIHTRLRRAREEAMTARLDIELSHGVLALPALRAKLVPKSEATRITSDASSLLEKLYDRALAVREVERFRVPLDVQLPLIPAPGENAVNIPVLSQAAKYSGFIDLPPSKDGSVRSLPLLVNYRGHAFPHMALNLACAMLDVKLTDIRSTPDSLILPIPNGKQIEIPIRTEHSSIYSDIGAMMYVPYFGKPDVGWLTMYDYPNHLSAAAHIPIKVIWTIAQLSDSIRKNNATADLALKDIHQLAAPQAAEKYLKSAPDISDTPARLSAIEATLKELADQGYVELLGKPEKELSADERAFVAPIQAMKDILQVNRDSLRTLESERAKLHNELRGKAVLINWTAEGRTDFYPTSLHGKCPGAVIQGVVFNGILTGNMWRATPRWISGLLTLGLGLLATVFVALLPPWRALGCTVVAVLGYAFLNGELLFDYHHLIVGAAGPISASVLVWFGLTLTNFIAERRERRRIRRRFSSYIDPALVEYGEEHPDLLRLEGQRREMTVVFTDLAGFTTISEKLGESTIPLLNAYFGKMVPIIRENRGYLNKFLGDGLMFFYNAPQENPNHAADAVRTILQMRQALISFNESLKQRGLPQVGMRAGMTTGDMVVGDAGSKSDDERHNGVDYTVLGDKVNLAARLEAANKFFGSSLLMNQRTRDLIGDAFLVRPIGKIVVVGKSEGVMTYEAFCARSEASPAQIQLAEVSTKLAQSYVAGEFDVCRQFADELERVTGDAKFAAVYRKLCTRHLKDGLDEDFTGQIVLSEK